MFGVATFPQGFICGINPFPTKQQTQQALQCWSGPCTEHPVHGPGTLPCCGHLLPLGLAHGRELLGSMLCLGGDIPRICSHARTYSQLSSTPLPPTPHSCQSLVIQPVPISSLSSRSITPTLTCHPSFCCWFVPSVLSLPFPISCQTASGSPNLRAAWPATISPAQQQAALAWGCSEHASVTGGWLVPPALGFSLPLGLQSCNIPWSCSTAAWLVLEKLQLGSWVGFKKSLKNL